MNDWYYSEDKKAKGPISKESLQEKINLGEIKRGTLVWCKGEVDWQPVETAFNLNQQLVDEKIVQKEDSGQAIELEMTPDKVEIQHLQHEGIPKHIYVWLAATVVCFGIFFSIHSKDYADFSSHTTFWLWSLASAIATSSVTLYQFSKYIKFSAEPDSFRLGKLKLIFSLSAVLLIAFAILFSAQIPTLQRIVKVRESYDTFSMKVDVAANTITVDGTIGPSFAAKLQQNLELYAGLDTIIITSAGGLLDQALAARKLIESHSLNVITRKTCNSACIIILMAGNKRYADWDMKLGFHGSSYITDMGETEPESTDEEADNFLLSKGVPKDVVQSGFGSGQKELTLVSPIDIAESSQIQLLEKNEIISLQEAKWLKIENSLNPDDANGFDVASTFKSIRETSPQIMNKYADGFYIAITTGEVEQAVSAFSVIASEIIPLAIQSGESEVLVKYLKNSFEQLEYLINLEQWPACKKYILGDNSGQMNILSGEFLKKEGESLSELIRSAGKKEWTPQPVPVWAKVRSQTLAEQAMTLIVNAGINIDNFENNDKAYCAFTYSYLKLVLAEPPTDIAPIFRAINLEE